jgi:2-oxo-3-hexenedioate decarboxylase
MTPYTMAHRAYGGHKHVPPTIRAMSAVHPRIAAATRAQLEAWRAALAAGGRRVGWKAALAIAEVEELMGAEPAIGHLTTATLLPPGGTYSATGDRELRAETELAIAVGEAGRVAGVAVALELVDVARPPDGMEAIVAGNVFHRAVAFGPVRPGPSAGGAEARMLVNGALCDAAAVAADPARTLAAVGRVLEAVGERLQPGELVLAGSACHVPAGPGDAVAAEIDGLGRVEATISG